MALGDGLRFRRGAARRGDAAGTFAGLGLGDELCFRRWTVLRGEAALACVRGGGGDGDDLSDTTGERMRREPDVAAGLASSALDRAALDGADFDVSSLLCAGLDCTGAGFAELDWDECEPVDDDRF